jgi:beta-galactosidase
VILPHTAVDLSWREWDPSTWERTWLYRKHFDVTTEPGIRHFLRFHAAMTTSAPKLNGQALAPHAGGYLPHSYEVTGVLGRHNTLEVVVDGSFDHQVPPNHGPGSPSSSVDFWQPAGLHREVELVSVPADHIADVFAKPIYVLDPARRRVDVRCELDLGNPGHDLRVDAELQRDGNVLAGATAHLTDLPAGRHGITLPLRSLADVALWSTESPQLYDVVVTLHRAGVPVHDHRVRTGFREARFDASGFFLNGQRLQLLGLNRHQFFPYAAGAMPARVHRRDAEILREELNCTMVRCSHYPQHEDFLDACDELGLLVWDEPPGWQHLGDDTWKERAYRDVRAMIVRDRNHPSVVLWAARLNETPDDTDFYARTEALAKSLDDSRQTTGAILGSDHDTTDFQHDVFGYNDYSASSTPEGTLSPELAPPRSDYPYLVSEAVGTLSGPSRFYRRTDSQPVQQGQALAHARVHDFAGSDERYSGVLAWAGFDYPSGHGNVFQGIKWPGVVDLFRVPKLGAAMYRAQVSPRRRTVIAPSFFWDFHPDSPVTDLGAGAAIWSNLEVLELFVGGRRHASLRPARGTYPNLPYPPFFADFSTVDGSVLPELRIDGYLDSSLVASRTFSSDRNQDMLSLTVDDAAITAGGSDATRAELRAVDAHGADRPYVAGEVALSVDGPAVLVGSNPFPLGETGGVGAVWVRSSSERTGRVKLRAAHPTLGTARAEITVTAM